MKRLPTRKARLSRTNARGRARHRPLLREGTTSSVCSYDGGVYGALTPVHSHRVYVKPKGCVLSRARRRTHSYTGRVGSGRMRLTRRARVRVRVFACEHGKVTTHLICQRKHVSFCFGRCVPVNKYARRDTVRARLREFFSRVFRGFLFFS